MIELTEADRAAIANAIAGTYARFETRKHDWGCCKDAAEDAIYRAGLAAGLERERDALKAERADLIKINNGWAHEWDAMREQVEEMRKVIEAAKANRETLSEIAGSKSLTATPTQFYQHLQRIAAKATAGPFDDLLAALDKEQK
jgi:chromosome segregation ATPase